MAAATYKYVDELPLDYDSRTVNKIRECQHNDNCIFSAFFVDLRYRFW